MSGSGSLLDARDGSRVACGFTLIELLAALAIVGILAGIVLGGGKRAGEAGKVAKAKAEIAALAGALEAYRREHGDYPRTGDAAEMVQALIGRRGVKGEAPGGRARIDVAQFTIEGGGDVFADAAARLVDPWGRPYFYFYKTGAPGAWKAPAFVLYSAGPNGVHVPPSDTGVVDVLHIDNADNLYAGL